MTAESCAMMNFAEKKLPMRFACLVSMPTPLPATSNSVSSRGFFEHVELQFSRVAVYSVWENEYTCNALG